MPHAALWVVQPNSPIRTLTDIIVSMLHAALWVVQLSGLRDRLLSLMFQCRTRLCGWCNKFPVRKFIGVSEVSMPHAALWVVQPGSSVLDSLIMSRFNAARGFVGGAARKHRHGT